MAEYVKDIDLQHYKFIILKSVRPFRLLKNGKIMIFLPPGTHHLVSSDYESLSIHEDILDSTEITYCEQFVDLHASNGIDDHLTSKGTKMITSSELEFLPKDESVANGTSVYCVDNGKVYMFDSSQKDWIEQ